MKKMYEAPVAEMIELKAQTAVLSTSTAIGEQGQQVPEDKKY